MHRCILSGLLLILPLSSAWAETIVCFGDSLTQGVGAPPGEAYPDFLRKDLARDGYRATVLNQGVGGEATGDGLKRVDKVLAEHPDIVVLELGPNDALYRNPVDGIKQRLGTMIEQFQKAHIHVVLAGVVLPAFIEEPYRSRFNPLYASVAEIYNLPLVPSLLNDVYAVPGRMSMDNIHPTAAGYERVAQNVETVVAPLLRK